MGSLIQEQMTRGNNWPFAAALAVVLMILTTLMIVLYRKLTNVKELEESDEKELKAFRTVPGNPVFLMYLPIGVVVVFSFNEARLPVRFTGFSLKWYQELFQDRDLIQALKNSLILAVSSCGVSAVIGTLGAVGLFRIHWKTKGVMEYISILPLMIPEIILGMVLMAFSIC